MSISPIQSYQAYGTNTASGATRGHWRNPASLQAAASALGMSTGDFSAALKGGTTVAQLAQQRGVSLDDLKSAILAPIRQQLSGSDQAPRLTQQAQNQINVMARTRAS